MTAPASSTHTGPGARDGHQSAAPRPAAGSHTAENLPPAADPRQPIRIARRHGQELRLSVAEARGRQYADLRSYWLDDDGQWRPGRGVTVPPAQWSAFCAGVVELDGQLRAAGLVDDEEEGGDGAP